MRGVDIAPTAVAARRHVNELMAKAKATSAGATSVQAPFRDYSVEHTDEKPAHWTAEQTTEVLGRDGEAVVDLVGRLLAHGLAISSLGWRISTDRTEQARQDVSLEALQSAGHQHQPGKAARTGGTGGSWR